MKALEILKDNLRKAEFFISTTVMNSNELKSWANIISEHKEAIKEIEDLIKANKCS